MGVITYSSVPSANQFRSDSSVTFAVRRKDIILSHIDWLLSKLETTPEKRPVILCDLFMTCNFWIKSYHERNPNIERQRYPAVLALFGSIVGALAKAWSCSQTKVAQTIREIYGRDMHTHGFQVDHGQGRAKYFSPIEAAQYRLRFKGGLAYQYQWWDPKLSHRLALADSSRCFTEVKRKGENGHMAVGSKDYCIFAMTLERVVFLGKADVGETDSHSGTFHSSFNGGGIVSMAGTIHIVHGRIKAIRADSGHYKPTEMNMALFLQALAMYGVPIQNIALYSYDGESRGFAFDFLKSRMSWTEFDKQRRLERAHRLHSDDYRDAIDMPKKFPNLKRGPAVHRPAVPHTNIPLPLVPASGGSDFYFAK